MGTSKGWTTILALPVLVLAVFGCGNSGESTAVSKEEFLRKGAAICKEWGENRSKLVYERAEQLHGRKPTDSEKEALVLALLSSFDETVGKLSALPPPAGEGARVKTMVDAMEAGIEKLRQEPLNPTIGATDPFHKSNDLAESYGLSYCVF